MPVLIVIAHSLANADSKDSVVKTIAKNILPRVSVKNNDVHVVAPEEICLELNTIVDPASIVHYVGVLGLEGNESTWRGFIGTRFDQIFIFGSSQHFDYQEIILSCFLESKTKTYHDVSGNEVDIDKWQRHINQDFQCRDVILHRLPESYQDKYFRRLNRWLTTELIAADFENPKTTQEKSPEMSSYMVNRLGRDLAQHAFYLIPEAHGASFSTLYFDRQLVYSSDFYRSAANFLRSIEGVESVLDVGCGSGFLACHLAASGRYASVTGVDSSPNRIEGARLHGSLIGTTARFDVMSMTRLDLPDRSVDLSVTMFALEQTGRHLKRALAEIRRVTRRLMVLFEPTTEFFPTVPSVWHVARMGWASSYATSLAELGLAYAVRPNLLNHYYNPGTVFVVDLTSDVHPFRSFPQLFRPSPLDWPGGVRIVG